MWISDVDVLIPTNYSVNEDDEIVPFCVVQASNTPLQRAIELHIIVNSKSALGETLFDV